MDLSDSPSNTTTNGYEMLKRDILHGVFKPGEKLLMNSLKERYALGVGPLREALSPLVTQRLVVATNQRGFRVASMSLEEMRDVYDARANLEAMILMLAIERGDDTWEAMILARAHTLSKVMEVNTQDQMMDVWDARHKAFHTAIASGCGSTHLMQARATLADQAERYRHLWLRTTVLSPEALASKRQEHSLLIDSILERDAPKASSMMRKHLLSPIPIIEKIMMKAPYS
ncbi:transcriptional regulator [Pseudomonas sp. RIT-PI-q]|uniref:DNA-binding transcriptional regulator CsiR n=1 Tax=Pseudomonas sp. RIT-PI-q TaxID=1690247 RepID=UPI0006CD98BE|nr:DNA-binding transcriptional regulator CsiR [Pseudomonas sp. RIT-PI-q]KPG96042.1 transcriptional regulator [Pseudomonas sp. RIT-PI-q]